MCISSAICVASSFTSNFVGLRIGLTIKLMICLMPETRAGLMGTVCSLLALIRWRLIHRSPSAVPVCKADKKPQTNPVHTLCTILPKPFCLLSGVRSQNYSDRVESSDDWHANVHKNCPTLLQFLFITSYYFQYQ